MKIFAAGIATETNTFSPLITALEDFVVQRGTVSSGNNEESRSFDLPQIWGRLAQARGHDFIFSLMAWAQPSGITTRSSYESLRDELLRDLRAAGAVDIVLLMLHGAMIAQGYADCEEDVIRRVRDVVGPKTVIAVELDLHCHLHTSKIADADIVITYKEYPHTDINERAAELFNLAVEAKMGRIRPVMTIFDCKMVGMYPTTRHQMQSVIQKMMEAEQRPGVLSVSFGHGFQFADIEHVGAKVLVVTDGDESLGREVARELGLEVYRKRREIGFDSLSLPMEEALSKALSSSKVPVIVADQSDNIGGGAPGDATFALRWLLERRAEDVAMAIFYDPEVVRVAKKAGEGAILSVRLGGKMGPSSGDPVDLDVTVLSLRLGYEHSLPQERGDPISFKAGDVVALRCGGIDIIVGSERCPCFSPSIFSDLGIDPAQKRLLIPKSAQHFYAAFSRISGEVIYMTAPGAVAPNPTKIQYARFRTDDKYPWVEAPLG